MVLYINRYRVFIEVSVSPLGTPFKLQKRPNTSLDDSIQHAVSKLLCLETSTRSVLMCLTKRCFVFRQDFSSTICFGRGEQLSQVIKTRDKPYAPSLYLLATSCTQGGLMKMTFCLNGKALEEDRKIHSLKL